MYTETVGLADRERETTAGVDFDLMKTEEYISCVNKGIELFNLLKDTLDEKQKKILFAYDDEIAKRESMIFDCYSS